MMPAIIAIIVFCAITGALAARKGYNFFLWFPAAGLLGLIILAFLPFAQTPQQRKTGNIIGACIGLPLVAIIILAILHDTHMH